ncbi:MAG: CcmD family protein [Bacteroidetes bacterium]|jgi:predicted permease|nr:CcmD family protein [Bacteroidota bacterium]
MERNKLISLFVLLALLPSVSMADVEMADTLRSDGKIYVVVTVLCIVLAVILIYLFSIDRKVKRMEDRFKNK